MAGGNWGDTSCWDEGAVPLATDAVVARAGGTSGSVTVNVASVCLSAVFTNYTGTLTHNAQLTVSGNVTLVAGMTLAGTTGPLIINSSATLTSAGKVIPCPFKFTPNATLTLADNASVTGLVTLGTGAAGAPSVNGAAFTLTCAGGLTLDSTSASIGGSAKIVLTGGTWSYTGASIGAIATNLDLQGNVTVSGTVNFGASGKTLKYVSGTITTTNSTLGLADVCTLDTVGVTWNNVTVSVSATTITNNSLLTATGTMTMPNVACTWAGTAGFTVGTLTNTTFTTSRIHTYSFGNTYTVTTAFSNVGATAAVRHAMKSGTPGSKVVFTVTAGASLTLSYCDPTDIDSSGGGQVFTFGGTITTSLNWTSSVVATSSSAYPTATDVRNGVQYGPSGTDFTGSLVCASGRTTDGKST